MDERNEISNAQTDSAHENGYGFDFSYSAPNSEEKRWIESIRREYLPQSEHEAKVVEIKKLHRKVKQVPSAIASFLGIIGMLILGVGMCMVLEWNQMIGGVIVGLLGMGIMLFTYPFYQFMLTRRKNKYAERIVTLADELSVNENDVKNKNDSL